MIGQSLGVLGEQPLGQSGFEYELQFAFVVDPERPCSRHHQDPGVQHLTGDSAETRLIAPAVQRCVGVGATHDERAALEGAPSVHRRVMEGHEDRLDVVVELLEQPRAKNLEQVLVFHVQVDGFVLEPPAGIGPYRASELEALLGHVDAGLVHAELGIE